MRGILQLMVIRKIMILDKENIPYYLNVILLILRLKNLIRIIAFTDLLFYMNKFE